MANATTPVIQINEGNVGIGTTGPIHKLAVNGKIGGLTFGDSYLQFTNGNAILKANDDVIIGYSSSFYVKQNGNVGIGTTSPSAILEVRGTAATYTNASTVFWGGTTNNDNHNGIMLSSFGDSLGGSLASNLLYSNSNTPTQTNTNRSSGQIKFGNTTIASKTSDINFGGYYKGTTTFVERMLIDSDGNVGIGITTPQAPLSFANVVGSKIDFYHSTTSSDRYGIEVQSSELRIHSGAQGSSTGGITFGKKTTSTFTEAMRITNAGNVGIGISNPVSYGKFVVQGTGNLINANASSGAATFQLYEGGQGRFAITTLNGSAGAKFELAGSEKMRIISTGNVGIGLTPNASYSNLQIKTPSSAYGLDLVGRDAGSSSESQITFWNSNQTSVLAAIVNSSDSLLFYTGTTERMRLVPDTGSSFAILKAEQGTYSSIAALSLYGTNSSTYGGSVVVRSSILSQTDGTAFGANLIFKTNNTSNVEQERIRIDSSGNVGIGMTSPSSFNQRVNAPHLVVGAGNNSAGLTLYSGTASQGSINFADGTTTTDQYTGGILYVHGSDNYMTFYTNGGGEKMRIGSDGAIKFNTYNLTNQTGTPTYLLGTDATGNVVKTNTVPGSGAGPYLPLAGGTMTGNITLPGEENNTFKIGFTGASATSGLSTVDQNGAGLYIGANSKLNNSGVVVYNNSALPSSGIYFDGWLGDDMEFYTGSSGNPTKRLTLSAGGDAIFTGNVGIGTTNLGTQSNLYLGAIDSNEGGQITFQKATSGTLAAHIDAFSTGTVDFMRILSGGDTSTTAAPFVFDLTNVRVGIGTTSPGNKLSIAEDMGTTFSNAFLGLKATLAATANTKTAISLATSTANNYGVTLNGIRQEAASGEPRFGINMHNNSSGGIEAFTIRSSGNVGIGTTSPQRKLTIYESSGNAVLQLANNTSGVGASDGFLVYTDGVNVGLENKENGYLSLATSASERMRITAAGNVGIATNSPSVQLEVANKSLTRHTSSSWGQSAIANPNDAECAFVWAAGGTGYPGITSTYTRQWIAGLSPFTTGTDRWSLTNKTLGANTAITVLEDGKIGMGTISPGSKLQVAGEIRVADGNKATPSYSFANDPDTGMFSDLANTLRFGTGANTRMTIEPSGEVGINTTGPSAALHLRALTTNGVPFKLEGDSNTTVEQMLIITSKAYNSTDAWYNLVTQAGDGSGGATNTCIIERDGDLRNKNNSYGQISDSRLKENIIDATPKLEDVMKVKVKNFNFIGEDLKQIGVVAQELEEVFPGLVKEEKQPDVNGEEGGIYKSVKYSVLVPILVKAMQEQQEIIEDLKTRITKLEN